MIIYKRAFAVCTKYRKLKKQRLVKQIIFIILIVTLIILIVQVFIQSISNAKELLNHCQNEIREAEIRISAILKPVKDLYLRLLVLEKCADGKVEIERMQILKMFRDFTTHLYHDLIPIIVHANKKRMCAYCVDFPVHLVIVFSCFSSLL